MKIAACVMCLSPSVLSAETAGTGPATDYEFVSRYGGHRTGRTRRKTRADQFPLADPLYVSYDRHPKEMADLSVTGGPDEAERPCGKPGRMRGVADQEHERGVTQDRPRLLARRSELGYTDSTLRALSHEPEAVSVEEQQRQTALAHRRAAFAREQQWWELRGDLLGIAERLRELLGARGAWAVRDLARVADRLDQQVRDDRTRGVR